MLIEKIIGLRALTERDSDSRENFPKYTRKYYSYSSYEDFLLNEHVRALHLVCKLTRLSQIPPFLSLTQNLKQFAEVFLYRKMLNWLKFLGIFPLIQRYSYIPSNFYSVADRFRVLNHWFQERRFHWLVLFVSSLFYWRICICLWTLLPKL